MKKCSIFLGTVILASSMTALAAPLFNVTPIHVRFYTPSGGTTDYTTYSSVAPSVPSTAGAVASNLSGASIALSSKYNDTGYNKYQISVAGYGANKFTNVLALKYHINIGQFSQDVVNNISFNANGVPNNLGIPQTFSVGTGGQAMCSWTINNAATAGSYNLAINCFDVPSAN